MSSFKKFIRTFGFLKNIPVLPQIVDVLMLGYSFIFRREVAQCIDALETEIREWNNVNRHLHKYGGIQFDVGKKEMGHIHGNGMVDIHFPMAIRNELIETGKALPHHTLPNSGWISIWIRTKEDKDIILELFRKSYEVWTPKDTN